MLHKLNCGLILTVNRYPVKARVWVVLMSKTAAHERVEPWVTMMS